MDIDSITIGEAKALVALIGGGVTQAQPAHMGKECIIRCYASGVHFGTVVAHTGRQVTLTQSRRCWRWDVTDHGISLSEVALHGGTSGRHLYCSELPEITLLDAIEIIPCTPKAISAIRAAPIAEAT